MCEQDYRSLAGAHGTEHSARWTTSGFALMDLVEVAHLDTDDDAPDPMGMHNRESRAQVSTDDCGRMEVTVVFRDAEQSRGRLCPLISNSKVPYLL